MKTTDVNLRVCATYHLNISAGDRIRRGNPVYTGSDPEKELTAPVSGIVRDVCFDPGSHEFVIRIHPS